MADENRSVPLPAALRYEREGPERAEEEREALRSRLDLERESNAHEREEQIRTLMGYGILCLMASVFFIAVVAVFVFAWHYLMPPSCHWLPETQLTALRTFIFSGAVSGLVSSYFQRHV